MASSDRLEPGKKGSIIARVDTSNIFGFIRKTIAIRSNDPKRPQIVLTLEMNVKTRPSAPAIIQTPSTETNWLIINNTAPR